MKKILIPIILIVAAAAAGAVILTLRNRGEKPVPIESFIKERHTADWYAHQAELWEQQVNRKPNDDDAWIDWFVATRYKIMFETQESHKGRGVQEEDFDYSPLKDIAARLANERPDSFARYYLDYMCSRMVNGYECEDNMEKAITMCPDKEKLYSNYVAYLIPKDNDDLMKTIVRKWYKSGRFPDTFISFFYNSLAGMEPDGILIVNGDVPVYATLMVQHGMNKFKDCTMVCVSFLYIPEYRKKICRQLGIEEFDEPQVHNSQELRKWEQYVFTTLAEKSGRPVYFTSTMDVSQYGLDFTGNLYSEGLVYKYSTNKYDNLSVKRRNFEEVYNTDYLYKKTKTKNKDRYQAEDAVNLNYIPCFKSLLTYYKETGNQKQETKLHSLLTHIVDNCSDNTDASIRKMYYDEIDR